MEYILDDVCLRFRISQLFVKSAIFTINISITLTLNLFFIPYKSRSNSLHPNLQLFLPVFLLLPNAIMKPNCRTKQAEERLERCRQRCINKIATGRMKYATKSARIEADIDNAKGMVFKFQDESEIEALKKQLQQLHVDMEIVESTFWNLRKWFIDSARLLGIRDEDVVPYIGGWGTDMAGAIPMDIQKDGVRNRNSDHGNL
jgi:hypothetical protein